MSEVGLVKVFHCRATVVEATNKSQLEGFGKAYLCYFFKTNKNGAELVNSWKIYRGM